MATRKDRINRLELEMRFQEWLWRQRLLESLSVKQLEEYACLGVLPDPLPASLPRGKSALDGLDRKRLRQLWEEDMSRFVGRGKDELIFFCIHGHWPEQECIERPCSKARSEGIVSQYKTQEASTDRTSVLAAVLSLSQA